MNKKFFTKLLSIALVCVMMIMCMGAAGGENQVTGTGDVYAVEEEFNANDYEHLTFNAPVENKNTINNRSSQALTNEAVIDEAIEFVHNLNLTESGFAYLEEECVLQLEGYKEQGVTLESYTVLVPKSTVGTYYGTSGGTDYYYNYISTADYRINTKGKVKSLSNEEQWRQWINGGIEIAMSFADASISVPFTLISTVVGIVDNSEIAYGAYNWYVARFGNVQTKLIYRGSPTHVAATNFRAEKGNARVKQYFCPVEFAIEEDFILIGVLYNKYLDRTNEFTKSYLLSYFPYANITGEIIDLPLGQLNFRETWN